MNRPLARGYSKISMAELQRLMRDPEFPDDCLKQFFIAYPDASRPFSPAIVPDPERVDVTAPADELEGAMMMDWANSLSRQRRQIKFRWRRDIGDQSPVLVSEGDSWFQFPLLLDDVIDQLADTFNIWSVDAAGDTLQNMVLDQPEYLTALQEQSGLVKAFLFSGGGNDFLGEDGSGQSVLTKILKGFKPGKAAEWYTETNAFAEKLQFVESCYQKVISSVAAAHPNLPVICHGYDYAIPGGGADDPRHPVYAAQDQWIGGPMREIGIVDPDLQRSIVRVLINKVNERISALCGGGGGSGAYQTAWYVDARGTLGAVGQWADELHPTSTGFALVTRKFREVVGRALPGIQTEPEAAHIEIAGAMEAATARPMSYPEKVAAVAKGELDQFHGTSEADEPLRSRINQYCREIGIPEPEDISDFPWSATFVSWCMKTAGATASEFKFDPAHAVFVKVAIANADAGTGVFRAKPIESYRPKVGDIIHRNRNGGSITYSRARRSSNYPSHSAIVVEVATADGVKFARTIGGNEGDSIRSTKVVLTPDGFVAQKEHNPFICVVENLKQDIAPALDAIFATGETTESFVCEGSGELEDEFESTASKPRVDRVEDTDHKSSRNGTKIDHIVIHYTTSRNIEGSISHFKNGTPRTSAHYIVGRDGQLVQMVPDAERAWHAGNSAMNARSIGIEHVAAPGDAIASAQARISLALIRWLMHEYGIPLANIIPHACVKSTSCCGDLFKDFGGGAGKSCDTQKAALHKWLRSNGIADVGPESTPHEISESGPEDRRLMMAKLIVDYEARRDAAGRLEVYSLPSGDGGGRYEVAGINEKYHKAECDELVHLIRSGKHAEAEQKAREYIGAITDRAAEWCRNGATEFFLRDCVFNRGPGGAARILQRAVGVEIDGDVGSETRAAVAAAELDIDGLLAALRQAREWYERTYAHRNESSRFWNGLVNRWNKAKIDALRFRASEESAPEVGPSTLPAATPTVAPSSEPVRLAASAGLAHLELAADLTLDVGEGIEFINKGPAFRSFADIGNDSPIDDPKGMLKGWRALRNGLQPEADFEAIIERDTSLPASFLQLLAEHRRAVGKINANGTNYQGLTGSWSGTGFLVGKNVLLTNHHVLNSQEVAREATVDFDYEVSPTDLIGGRQEPENSSADRRYRLNPDKLFLTSPATGGGLDFTFVWIETGQDELPFTITLRRSSFAVSEGEQAFVIHHPKGHGKRVSVDDVDVIDINTTVVRYVSDTMPGSSGSPVFDRQGRLFALHHASKEGDFRRPDGRSVKMVNEGIKTAAIVSDLERRESQAEKAMAEIILKLVQGSDTMAGFFGSLGREARIQPGTSDVEAVVDSYRGSDADLDIGFWNIEWLANRYRDATKLREAAAVITDLSLDIWGLEEVSPPAVRALVQELERNFRQKYDFALSEPNAPEGKQSTAVIWNTKTVEGVSERWPDEIEPYWHLQSTDRLEAENRLEAVDGRIFNRYPGLFRMRAKSSIRPFEFYLTPLHLKAMDEGQKRRELASRLIARAVKIMAARYGTDLDWVIGGDFNAELVTGDFQDLLDSGLKAMSAADEQAGAFSYIKSPRSLIDHIFLSSNLAQRISGEAYFIVAKDRSVESYTRKLSDHRPVLVRLSLGPEPKIGTPANEVDAQIDKLLARRRVADWA